MDRKYSCVLLGPTILEAGHHTVRKLKQPLELSHAYTHVRALREDPGQSWSPIPNASKWTYRWHQSTAILSFLDSVFLDPKCRNQQTLISVQAPLAIWMIPLPFEHQRWMFHAMEFGVTCATRAVTRRQWWKSFQRNHGSCLDPAWS